MHARGTDCWPASLTGDLVEESHHGWAVRCYPAGRPRTLNDILDRAAGRFPDREAVVTPEGRLTWGEFRARVTRLAAGLHARHALKPGDRVALLLMNGLPFCLAVFACARLGVIAVTLNTKLKSRELEYMLAHSGARLVLTQPPSWAQVEPIRVAIPAEEVYVVGGAPAGTVAWDALDGDPRALPAVTVGEDDTAFIMYTSGTTGRPKGAEGTHGGIVNSVLSYERCLALRDDERSLVAVPLFHVTGLIAQFLTMAHLGGTTVVMPTFNASEALRLIDAERITHLIAAPTVFVMLMLEPGYRERGGSLRVLAYGGAPTSPDTIRALREWLPQARLHNAYGMTETCSPVTILADADALAQVSTVGRPIPTAEVRTVHGERGAECGAGEVGELWVRGPMVIPRYWANPEGTAMAIGGGWLRTGDLARIDAGGYVTIMDRIKDMINRGGEKIFCVEVEDVLGTHPDVLEAAVVGVADPVYGEAVKACVIPRPGHVVDPVALRAWVAARLARFKVPRDVEIRDSLPRNPNGKVIKAELRG